MVGAGDDLGADAAARRHDIEESQQKFVLRVDALHAVGVFAASEVVADLDFHGLVRAFHRFDKIMII